METTLDAALAYASRGWHVFPVAAAPNKHPLCHGGFHDATTDHATIVSWWQKWPSAQVGVACGASGIVTVDVDHKPDDGIDGHLSLEELQMEHGGLGCGLGMKTPRGTGEQLFFADPEHRCRRRLGVRRGVDVLGDGGYSILPSPASPGREWMFGSWDDEDDLVEAPAWLVGLASSGMDAEKRPEGPRVAGTAAPTPMPPAQAHEIREALKYIDNWERGTWLTVGFALKSTNAGEQAFELWDEWSRSTPNGGVHPKYDAKDQRRCWRYAKEFFVDGSEVSLASLFHLARMGGYEGPGIDAEDDWGVEIRIGRATQAELPAVVEQVDDSTPTVVDFDAPLPTTSSILLSDWTDIRELPPIEWQIEGLLPRESVAVLGGDTQAGKSFLLLDLVLHMVHGMRWLGRRIETGNVIYLCGEGHGGLGGRLRAWSAAHPEAGTPRGYFVISDQIPLLGAKTTNKLHDLVQLVARSKGAAPSLIVVDTLSQALADDENDAKVMAPIMRSLAALRLRWRCSIMLAHHLAKAATGKGGKPIAAPGLDSLRGSSAITRNVDTVWGLVTDNDARRLHVWKQKDGAKPAPISLHLQQTETGFELRDGQPETSCVILPEVVLGDALAPRAATPEPEPQAAPTIDDLARMVADTLRAANAVPGGAGGISGGDIAQRMPVRRGLALAAVREAARRGLVRNVGQASRPCYIADPL